jgi:peptide deformylase
MYEKITKVKSFFSSDKINAPMRCFGKKQQHHDIIFLPFFVTLKLRIKQMEKGLDLLQFPDERLRRVSKPIENFDAELTALSDSMLRVMYESRGIGLAAPQINHPIRMIVIDISEDRNTPLIFVNPKLTSFEGNIESNEGCLSVPEIRTTVKRHKTINLLAQNIDGAEINIEADDLLSICIQHEIDHLDGKLFIDYVPNIKLQRLRKKIAKQKKLPNNQTPQGTTVSIV